jgi:MtN3 and saliva related transmembrane protein
MSLMTVCGIIAGICTTGALVPQVYRSAKLRSATEIAIGFLAVYGFGVGLFWVYGFRHDDLTFQVAQLATALLVVAMILLTVAYGDTSSRAGTAVISLMILIPAAAYLLDVNAEAICTVAAILAAISLLPQVLRIARLKSADDLSWMYLVTFGLGTTLWFIYGLALHAPPFYVQQAVTDVFIAAMFVLKGVGLRTEHAAGNIGVNVGPQQPIIAERDWWTKARVRIMATTAVDSVDPTFRIDEERTMVQWGRDGCPVERDCWWTLADLDVANIIAADQVTILEILDEAPPIFADAALPADRVVELLGAAAATWAEQGIFVIPRREHLEVRASDGELLGLVDVDRDCQPTQPIRYRAVIVPSDWISHSVPMPHGFVPERPACTADSERMRWRNAPGVKAPTKVRS